MRGSSHRAIRLVTSAVALALALSSGSAMARSSEDAVAIVAKFNRVWGGAYTRDELTAMLSEDFIEHHPTAGIPERTKAEFVAHFGRDPATPPKVPKSAMPAPVVTMATPDQVMLMMRRVLKHPNKPDVTYEGFAFDLYRLDAEGRIAEHWDSWTMADKPPLPPAKAVQ